MAITPIGLATYSPLFIKEKVVSIKSDEKGGKYRIIVDLGGDSVVSSFDTVQDRDSILSQLITEIGTQNIIEAPAMEQETQTLLTRMEAYVAPTYERKKAINALINSLKDAGVWAKLDSMYVFASHDVDCAKLDWVRSAEAATVVSPLAGIAHVVDVGFSGSDDEGDYIATAYNPSVDAVNLAANSMSVVTYLGDDNVAAANAGEFLFGVESAGANLYLGVADADDVITAKAGSDNEATDPATQTIAGDWMLIRDGNSVVVKSGGVAKATLADADTTPTLPNAEIYIGARNEADVAVGTINVTKKAFVVGAALTAGDITALNTAMNTYIAAVAP